MDRDFGRGDRAISIERNSSEIWIGISEGGSSDIDRKGLERDGDRDFGRGNRAISIERYSSGKGIEISGGGIERYR